jgi:DNA polymerase-3 subunit gamma/tau
MSLGGFARQFMDQSELLGVSGDVFHVRVPIKALAEGPASGKVTEALSQRFGRPIRLKIEVGAVTGVTAAGLAEQDRSQRLAQARASIEADPFVQTLVQDFGGSIVAGSVQPADGSDG